MTLAQMFTRNFGGGELLLILLALILLFGAKRLPELARSLGKSMSEFKKGREEGHASSVDKKDGDKPESPTKV